MSIIIVDLNNFLRREILILKDTNLFQFLNNLIRIKLRILAVDVVIYKAAQATKRKV